MPLTDTELNFAVDGLTARASHVSLHTGSPGSTGTSEVTGGGYARQAVTWTSAASGSAEATTELVFDVPADITVTHVGYWSASSGGTFRGYATLETPVVVPAGGARIITLTVSSLVVQAP